MRLFELYGNSPSLHQSMTEVFFLHPLILFNPLLLNTLLRVPTYLPYFLDLPPPYYAHYFFLHFSDWFWWKSTTGFWLKVEKETHTQRREKEAWCFQDTEFTKHAKRSPRILSRCKVKLVKAMLAFLTQPDVAWQTPSTLWQVAQTFFSSPPTCLLVGWSLL